MDDVAVEHVMAIVKGMRTRAVQLMLDDVRGLAHRMHATPGYGDWYGVDAETMAELKGRLESELRRRKVYDLHHKRP
jgi:hypothetical protein